MKTFLFEVMFHEQGLFSVVGGTSTKEEYLITNPTYFDCDMCDTQGILPYEIIREGGTRFWCCSELCANALILREL